MASIAHDSEASEADLSGLIAPNFFAKSLLRSSAYPEVAGYAHRVIVTNPFE
jgi:hypothetical protein